jgi:hypothetical protein
MSTSFATINFEEPATATPIKLVKCRPPKFKNHSIQLLGSQAAKSATNIEAEIVPLPNKVSIVPKRTYKAETDTVATEKTEPPSIDSVAYNDYITTLTRQPAKKRKQTELQSNKNSFNEITSTEVEEVQHVQEEEQQQQPPTNDLYELNVTLASQIKNFEEFKSVLVSDFSQSLDRLLIPSSFYFRLGRWKVFLPPSKVI